jgi:hypothetical protein
MDGMRVDQTSDNGGTLGSGTYTVPNANGVFTLNMIPTGQTSGQTFVVYTIDANRMFILETAGDTGLLVGDMRTQLGYGLSASAILEGYGYVYSTASGKVTSTNNALLYQVSGSGTNLTVNQSYDTASASTGGTTTGAENGQIYTVTFDSSNPGRSYFTPTNSTGDTSYLYFFNNNNAMYLDLNGTTNTLRTGWMEQQTQTTFPNTAQPGSYVYGRLPELPIGNTEQVLEENFNPNGAFSQTGSLGGPGTFNWDQESFGYTWSTISSTYGLYNIHAKECGVINLTRIVCYNGSLYVILQQ